MSKFSPMGGGGEWGVVGGWGGYLCGLEQHGGKSVGEAEMNGGAGSDFFIFRRGLWDGLPPVATGRADYDNVLMWTCLKKRVPMVDVTNAILPLHPKHNYNHVADGRQIV